MSLQPRPPSPFQLKAKRRATLEADASGVVYRPTSTAIRLEVSSAAIEGVFMHRMCRPQGAGRGLEGCPPPLPPS